MAIWQATSPPKRRIFAGRGDRSHCPSSASRTTRSAATSRRAAPRGPGRGHRSRSRHRRGRGLCRAGWLVDALGPEPSSVLDLSQAARLPGSHNWQNAAAAYAAARRVGSRRSRGQSDSRTFPGLAHRQELVATIDGVRFITIRRRPMPMPRKGAGVLSGNLLIAGGLPKSRGITSLAPYFGRLRHAY